jgi:hypothetical protein
MRAAEKNNIRETNALEYLSLAAISRASLSLIATNCADNSSELLGFL